MDAATIKKWQEFIRANFEPISVDGIYGPQTRMATVRAQQALGVVADGIIGPKTIAAMAGYQKLVSSDPIEPSLIGCDSLAPVTQSTIVKLAQVGAKPLFWGRYLSRIRQSEIDVLRENNIKLLPICQYLPIRNSTLLFSSECAYNNPHRAIEFADHAVYEVGKITSEKSRLIFADIEMLPTANPVFIDAWAERISQLGHKPALYMPNRLHPKQWDSYNKTTVPIAALWIAMYVQPSDGRAVYHDVAWDTLWSDGHPCTQVNDHHNTPLVAWQAIGNAYNQLVDFNVVNPNEQWFLDDLVSHVSKG